ncbi:rRNA pseudouridine synthase [bacterium]|nr:rRNA pseudouridine synthase [bacterium]
MARDDRNPGPDLRLNQYLARAGFGSRRSVEELIRAGRVAIDGETATDLGRRIVPGREAVTVDGRPATTPDDHRVYAFHKPRDVVSTLRSQGGQPALLPYRRQADLPDRFMPVGRLDSATTGLLLWTDDGRLNQDLCRPGSGLWKVYEVEVNGEVTGAMKGRLTQGKIELDGRPCRPCRLEPRRDGTTRQWVMELHEGRKRQIRRMFAAVGLKVVHLHRTAVGPIRLGLLRPGDFRRLAPDEVAALRRAVATATDP